MAYYINLKHRVERKHNAKKQLANVNIAYKRFEAIQSNDGRLGCSLSHLAVLELAKKQGLSSVIICEDDIYFKTPELFKKQLYSFLKSEDNWDVLLFGGNVVPPFSLTSPYAIKITHCQTTTGYMVKQHYYDTMIQNIRSGIKNLLQFPEKHSEYAIDKFWLPLQKKDNWFLIYPLMVTQRKGYSDIEKKIVDYESLLLTPRRYPM